jgi:hypothetical protein
MSRLLGDTNLPPASASKCINSPNCASAPKITFLLQTQPRSSKVATTIMMAEATEALNDRTASAQLLSEYEVTSSSYTTSTSTSVDSDSEPPSSPFVTNIPEDADRENRSPKKPHRLASVEQAQSSPLKMFKSRASPNMAQSPQKPEAMRSPRKISSPEKRFPVRPSSPEKRPVIEERTISIDHVLRDNEGLTKAIAILEDEDSEFHGEVEDTLTNVGRYGQEEAPNMDDTMVSTFSTFSAVPDMTMFSKIGHSPSKYAQMGPTPRRTQEMTPATVRRPMDDGVSSPTPRGNKYGKDEGNTTNLILDFTDQISGFSGRLDPLSPTKQARSPIKNSTMPDISRYGSVTPASNRMSNLLDFDIPPAPTPRSVPSITPRELESLKSSFLSEISSLKASLSGKEAEVQSLKTAVGDAEMRVGESLEQVREERSSKEQLAAEKEEWEKRGREMEAVLRNVKDEIVNGERDREDLEGRLEETERRREAAEMMAQEAESKMAAMRANKGLPTSEAADVKPGECVCGGRAVELAVEKVSRELHTLYKEKHESKVAALKKSYERRWDKKIKELEGQVEDLNKENEELKLGRNTTMTQIEPKNPLEVTEDLEKQAARDARTKELEAELEGLSQVVKSVKRDNSELRQLLDDERVEKGKLVQAVDEMIPLVEAFNELMDKQLPPTPSIDNSPRPRSQAENPRNSISRVSGLRAPTSISSIPTVDYGRQKETYNEMRPEQARTLGAAKIRPGSGLGYRSGIMNSIEKMGSYKGRAE